MAHYYQSVEEMIGHTPLLELTHIEKNDGLSARVFAKIESRNPAGSAKDRVALQMILDAEKSGLLTQGATIIEPTSGNTGIGLASVAVSRGYKAIIVMPDSMSEERKMLMKAFGAELVLTPGALGMAGAIQKAEELKAATPGAFIPGQFENPSNPKAHYRTTGPEIWEDLDGEVDIFVAGIGTGGTISGTGKYLKEMNPNIKVVGIEPATSAVLQGNPAGKHGIQGIGAGFVPKALDTTIYDELVSVTNEEAFAAARRTGTEEGFLVGISSGAALHAALLLAAKPENAGKNIVVLFPDSGDRYLSTDLYK